MSLRKLLALFAIPALLAAIFMLFSGDETLAPEVAAWLVNPAEKVKDEDNGYIYLIGILAGEKDDPYQVGLQTIDSLTTREQDSGFYRAVKAEEHRPSDQLELPQSRLLCARGRPDCLTRILQRSDEIEQLLKGNRVLLDRYRSFLTHANYETSSASFADDIDLPYYVVTRVNRLLHLRVIKQLLDGQQRDAADTLMNDVIALRSLLGMADDFILKMTLTSALAEDFQLMSQLYSRGYYDERVIDPNNKIFDHFSELERSWELDMKRRFRRHAERVYTFFDGLDLSAEGINPLAWSVAPLHKPNKTLNDIHPKFDRNYQLSVMSPSRFLDSSSNRTAEKNIFTRSNIIGSILNRKAMVSYEAYIGMMKDTECFMKLVKIRLSLPARIIGSGIDLDQLAATMDIRNPYNGRRPFMDVLSERICFSSRPNHNGFDQLCVEL
jgi:hypothetical protein|tara:strand:- start:372 stop:1688 length:1317 start_codon:yes stop_codon:yes gene_type:complete